MKTINILRAAILSLSALMPTLVSGVELAVTPVLLLEQSEITGVSDTIKAARVPVRNSSGAIKYYEIEMKFEVGADGKPFLADAYPVIEESQTLVVGRFKSGKYKDGEGNIYNLSGPGAAGGGRTSWAIQLVKRCTYCSYDSLSGSWITGKIAGHPIQSILNSQKITTTAFSWGVVSTYSIGQLDDCSDDNLAVGLTQSGNQVTLNGFCTVGSNKLTGILTLNLCTPANPC